MNIASKALIGLSICLLASLPTFAMAQDIPALEAEARKEGSFASLGMPDEWANWGALWKAIDTRYSVTHVDTDMTSAEQLAKFEAEKANPTADICEVGAEFAPVATKKGLAASFKTSNWDKIPDWAKAPDGTWAIHYTGTVAFVVNKKVKSPPKSFSDLATGDYKVTVGEVGKRAAANVAVLAAAVALGGSEADLQPGIDLFIKLAQQKRLLTINPVIALMEREEIEVGIVFDFNALAWRDVVGRDKWDVVIPSDGSVSSGFSTIINPVAKHPALAKLTREFAFSDEGQILFAEGYARPVRVDQITLPADVQAKLLPSAQYAHARPIDPVAWPASARKLTQMWQEQVAPKL